MHGVSIVNAQISNMFLFRNKILVVSAGSHKMLV